MSFESDLISDITRPLGDTGDDGTQFGTDGLVDEEALKTLLLMEQLRRRRGVGGAPQSFTNPLEAIPQAFNAPGGQFGPVTLLPRGPSDFKGSDMANFLVGLGNAMESRRVNQPKKKKKKTKKIPGTVRV